MRWFRRLFLLGSLLAAGALIWAGVYARKQGFTQSWRGAIEREFAARGYHVEIGKVTLGAFRGLVAENVTFFEDEDRGEGIAVLDRVYLDVDLSRIMRKEVTVKTLDVEEASLSLPLDPARPFGRRLLVEGISGRVVFTESMIEVVRAEARFGGVDWEFKGSLTRAPESGGGRRDPVGEGLEGAVGEEERASEGTSPLLRGSAMGGFRKGAERALKELDQFEFHGGAPSISVDFRGVTDDLAATSVRLELEAVDVGRKGGAYRLAALSAKGQFHGADRRLEIDRIALRDDEGDLGLVGGWDAASRRFRFTVESDLDLSGLSSWLSEDRRWREVVFFSPPRLRAEGFVCLDRLSGRGDGEAEGGFPGELLGEFQAGRFVTRGVVFEGLDFGCSIEGERIYLRNARLDHQTGVAFLNLKHEPGSGGETLQYQTEIKLDPHVFRPFLDEGARRFLGAWSFSEMSTVYLAAAGRGGSLLPSHWENRGVLQFRNFWLNGVDFLEMKAEFESGGDGSWLREIHLAREEGAIEVEMARYDPARKVWELRGGGSTLDPLEAARAFYPGLTTGLGVCHFDEPPRLRFSGELDSRPAAEVGEGPRVNKLTLSFESAGPARYAILGRELSADRSRGELAIEGSRVHLRGFRAESGDGGFELDYLAKDLRDPAQPFALKARFEGFPLEALAPAVPSGETPAAAGGKSEGEGEGDDSLVEGELGFEGGGAEVGSWRGGGWLRIAGGDLVSRPLAGSLLRETGLGAPGGEEEEVGIPYELAGSFRFGAGLLHLEEISAGWSGIRLVAAGELGLDTGGLLRLEAAAIGAPDADPRGFAASGIRGALEWEEREVSAFEWIGERSLAELTTPRPPQTEEVEVEKADAAPEGAEHGGGSSNPPDEE